MENADNIEKFLNKITEIQYRQTSSFLSLSDLKELAIDTGMTEQDWTKVMSDHDKHLLAGNAFLRYKNYDDAITEYNQALIIHPYNSETLLALSETYLEKWRQSNSNSDKKEAEKYARKCLEINKVDEKAIQIISILKRPEQLPANSSKSKKKPLFFLVLGVVVFIAMLLIFLSLFRSQEMPSTNMISEQTQPLEAIQVANGYRIFDQWDIPILYLQDQKTEDIDLTIESAQLKDYGSSYSYELTGYFIPENIILNELHIKIELLDQNNQVQVVDVVQVIEKHNPAARSGDMYPFNFLHYSKEENIPSFREVRISVDYLNKDQAAGAYNESPIKDFLWTANKPANYDIAIRERMLSVSKSSNQLAYKVELEVMNTGNMPIKQLQLRINWLNHQNTSVDSDEFYITISTHPPIKTGQVRLYGRLWLLKSIPIEEYGNYTLEVISIQ